MCHPEQHPVPSTHLWPRRPRSPRAAGLSHLVAILDPPFVLNAGRMQLATRLASLCWLIGQGNVLVFRETTTTRMEMLSWFPKIRGLPTQRAIDLVFPGSRISHLGRGTF